MQKHLSLQRDGFSDLSNLLPWSADLEAWWYRLNSACMDTTSIAYKAVKMGRGFPFLMGHTYRSIALVLSQTCPNPRLSFYSSTMCSQLFSIYFIMHKFWQLDFGWLYLCLMKTIKWDYFIQCYWYLVKAVLIWQKTVRFIL